MQEFELHYQLAKEDYLDWIHWNVKRHSSKKMKVISLVIYIGFLVVYLGGSIIAKKPPAAIMSSLVTVLMLGAFMFYLISPKHQERMVWKKSGLQKLEKANGFPHVNLVAYNNRVMMEVPDQFSKEYSFVEIPNWEETERLFLMGTNDKTWQFIAKTAFENQEQMDAFRTYMMEKIEDAKENPDRYTIEPEEEQTESELSAEETGYSGNESIELEEDIQPVDTTSMGKIGKMAHIMAAMAAENGAEDTNEAGDTNEAENEQATEHEEEAGEQTDEDQDSDK